MSRSYAPADHYDRVMAAWTLLMGEELHYGVFRTGDEPLDVATRALTDSMLEAACIDAGHDVLDVGCGTGAPAATIASVTGARVTGITTSPEGVAAARARTVGDERVGFELRDGMDNGFADASFDRVWVLESSHLMRERDRLMAECGRVLRAGGRMALCDIVLRRELDLREVRRLREPLGLLRRAFGDARMEPVEEYRRLALAAGLDGFESVDLTAATRPTFARWRDNCNQHRATVVDAIGADALDEFAASCDVLEQFWDDGTLGYALVTAVRA